VNEKIYIHEYIDIIGHQRANYMHHMTANFSPIGQQERNQLCYGVWGVVGSTGRWPQVVNIWEEDGLEGIARSFRHELSHPSLQNPTLATWWAKAAEFRSGGTDRLLRPAPWTRTIEELCRDKVGGEVYAHEAITVPPGSSSEYLEAVRAEAIPAYEELGWELAGAWEAIMTDESECFLVWAIPTWEQWAEFEQSLRSRPRLSKWWAGSLRRTTSFRRILLVDSPLCPFRTHRQPAFGDQTDWKD
jgi:hypothetical protein